MLPEMFDHALKLVDPNSASGKELLKAKRAQIAGDNYAVRRALYKAFDKLPTSEKKYVLGVDQKRTIEDQISQLLQTEPKINSSKLKKVDELASKSYDHLQKGGSLMSYRYLLEALDLAESPVSKELVQRLLSEALVRELLYTSKSKSKKIQFFVKQKTDLALFNRIKSIGGAHVPVIPPIPAGAGVAGLGAAPLPIVIGFSTLGILTIAFIIYTLLERPTQEPPQVLDQPDQPAPDQPDQSAQVAPNQAQSPRPIVSESRPTRNLQRAPTIYAAMPAMPKAKTSQYDKIPQKSPQVAPSSVAPSSVTPSSVAPSSVAPSSVDPGVGFIGRPASNKWSSAPSNIFLSKSIISSKSPFQRRQRPSKSQETRESGNRNQTKDKDRRQLDRYCQELQKIEESDLNESYYRDYLLEVHKFVRSIVQKYQIDTKNLKPGTDVLDIITNCEFLKQALD